MTRQAVLHPLAAVVVICCAVGLAGAGQIVVELPDHLRAKECAAVARTLDLSSPGKITGQTITFDNLLPDTPYDLRIVLADGVVLQGVDLSWHSLEPPDEHAEPMSDDDREQIRAIVQDVLGFYNKNEILLLRGDGQRAVALVQLIRDKEFYADKGGEIVWRMEIWYFQNQYGGWEKVQQQNKILRRERFRNRAAYDADAGKIRWVAELGGIVVSKQDPTAKLTLPASVLVEEPTAAPPSP